MSERRILACPQPCAGRASGARLCRKPHQDQVEERQAAEFPLNLQKLPRKFLKGMQSRCLVRDRVLLWGQQPRLHTTGFLSPPAVQTGRTPLNTAGTLQRTGTQAWQGACRHPHLPNTFSPPGVPPDMPAVSSPWWICLRKACRQGSQQPAPDSPSI